MRQRRGGAGCWEWVVKEQEVRTRILGKISVADIYSIYFDNVTLDEKDKMWHKLVV